MPSGVPEIVVAAPVKHWWKSRTLWFNLIVAAVAAAELGFPALKPLLPDNLYLLLTFVLVVGNALLRAVTTKALAP